MLSIVVPVYRNEGSVPDLLAALSAIHARAVGGLEVVFVVDGSPDRCYELLRDTLSEMPFASQLILLARNFGSFAAIRAGLAAARGQYFAVMAADLQEPPALMLQMHDLLRAGDLDVVVGVRDGRADPAFSRFSAAVFWGLYRRFVVAEIPPGGIDVFGCNDAFRRQLLQLEERHSSLVAQVFWLGFRRGVIPYARLKRLQGTSAWTYRKKVNYLMDSVFAFTDLPIRLLLRTGGLATMLSLLFGLVVVIARLFGAIPVPGYAATILVIVFFGALNLFALGIIGSYAWRTYENTKARPLHVVLRAHSYSPRGSL